MALVAGAVAADPPVLATFDTSNQWPRRRGRSESPKVRGCSRSPGGAVGLLGRPSAKSTE
jgi:hypothetical protein